jgi:hypothetical protein
MEGVKIRLSSQAADFSDTGIHKLIPRYYKCLSSAVTTLRSSLSIYEFFVDIFFSLLVLLTTRQKLLSDYPSY